MSIMTTGGTTMISNVNSGGVASGAPKNPTVFTFSQQVTLTGLEDYHYNNNGAAAGTIGLMDASGKMYGPWQAAGAAAGNVQNGWWQVTTTTVLPAGTYTVVDSDPGTWSNDEESGYQGFSTAYLSAGSGTSPAPVLQVTSVATEGSAVSSGGSGAGTIEAPTSSKECESDGGQWDFDNDYCILPQDEGSAGAEVTESGSAGTSENTQMEVPLATAVETSPAQQVQVTETQVATSATALQTQVSAQTTIVQTTPVIQPAPQTQEQIQDAVTSAGLQPASIGNVESTTAQVLVNMPQALKDDTKTAISQKNAAITNTPVIPDTPTTGKSEDQEGYLEKGWNWLTWGAGKTKEIYEGVGEEAPHGAGALDLAGKGTETVKDVTEIGKAFNSVNEQVQSGEMSDSSGKLLKVGYGLGKAIKWTAKNVPVVGDAVGDAADGAFSTSMKAGEKLATHTDMTNKCMDDPLSDECINFWSSNKASS
jgi:hypothetical protein